MGNEVNGEKRRDESISKEIIISAALDAESPLLSGSLHTMNQALLGAGVWGWGLPVPRSMVTPVSWEPKLVDIQLHVESVLGVKIL